LSTWIRSEVKVNVTKLYTPLKQENIFSINATVISSHGTLNKNL